MKMTKKQFREYIKAQALKLIKQNKKISLKEDVNKTKFKTVLTLQYDQMFGGEIQTKINNIQQFKIYPELEQEDIGIKVDVEVSLTMELKDILDKVRRMAITVLSQQISDSLQQILTKQLKIKYKEYNQINIMTKNNIIVDTLFNSLHEDNYNFNIQIQGELYK